MANVAPGTVAFEALQWLRSLSGAEVSTIELAKGIGRDAGRIKQQLSPAVKAGILSRRVEAGFAFWRLGPNADSALAPTTTPDESERHRVVKVSAAATSSIFAYADQRAAAPFSVALHTDGRMSLERHGRLIAELTNDERKVLVNTAAHGVRT